jgi:hypothetical protein
MDGLSRGARGICRLLLFFLIAAPAALAGGKKEAPGTPAQNESRPGTEAGNPRRPLGELTLTGRVRLTGTARFPELVLSDNENRDWYIAREDTPKLSGYEQRTVTVRGSAFVQDRILANGEKNGLYHTLRDIELLAAD